MDRKEFVKLSSGVLSGLGVNGFFNGESRAEGKEVALLDDSYLVAGLTGMARSKGWFPAHLGAAVLAGYYLCKENDLGEEVTEAIRKQLDSLIKSGGVQFDSLPDEKPDENLIGNIATSLVPAMEGGLRAHGHAVIFTALSTRALRDAPWMAKPSLINPLCGHNRSIARKKPQAPLNREPYTNSQEMIESTFDSLARFKDLLGRPSIRRPNFTHMTTHTEALMTLEQMGFKELSQKGYPGHRAHIEAPVPVIDPADPTGKHDRITLEQLMDRSFWSSKANVDQWNRNWSGKDNPNGYWVAFGHLFKVLYSYHRLIGYIDDKEKVSLCSEILLERYFNPETSGG